MAITENEFPITLEASADLSTKQYRFVTLSSGQVAVVASAGADAIGVLSDKPAAAGRPARVVVGGVTKVILGATVAQDAEVQSDANGAGITAASGDYVLGKALEGGDSGDIVAVLLGSNHLNA